MNIMKTNMLSLNNKFMKEDSGNTTATQAPVPSTTDQQKGMKALSFLGMQNLMANPKLAQEVGVMDKAPYSSNIAFQGNKFAGAAKLAGIAAAAVLAGSTLTSCEKDIQVTSTQTVVVDVQAIVDAINQLRADINAHQQAETERNKEIVEALNKVLTVMYQLQTLVSNNSLTIEKFKELVLGKMENGELQRSAILEAIILLQNKSEQSAINAVNIIINALEKNQISFEEAMAQIQALLKDNNSLLAEIKEMLAKHFDKYDTDMAELKSIANDIKVDVQGTREDIQKFANIVATTSIDIKNIGDDIKAIKTSINNGIQLDDAAIIELLKKINADQNMSREQIIAKIDEYLAKQDAIAGKLDNTNNLLTKLGFVVSNDVINAINNIGDDLQGLDGVNDKLADLLAAVKSLSVAFDLHAKYAVNAHEEEMTALNDIKDNIKNIKTDISELIKQGQKAETSRAAMESYLQALIKKAEDIEAKLGRIPTVDEFSVMLDKHDADNRKYYGDLIKAAGVDPAEFENIKDLLTTINKNLVDFQGTSNKLLADILAKLNAMDKTAPDYTQKLDKIIERLENFKFECNCKCDCDNNQTVHEGIIDIIS